jgi:hypothetical protein
MNLVDSESVFLHKNWCCSETDSSKMGGECEKTKFEAVVGAKVRLREGKDGQACGYIVFHPIRQL